MDERNEAAADLADAVLSVARKITVRDHAAGVDVLSPVESLVLRVVSSAPGISPSAAAARVGLTSSNMSAALRSLEARGLVRRSPDPADRRCVRLASTGLAAENLDRIRAGWAAMLAPLVGDDPARLDATLALLGALDERLAPPPEGRPGPSRPAGAASRGDALVTSQESEAAHV